MGIVSVADYGAPGDGTDQTVAIQAAEDAVAVKGGILYWPGGDYAINDTGIAKKGGVSWLGSGAVIRPTASPSPRTKSLVEGLAIGGFFIRGLIFDWRSMPNGPGLLLSCLGLTLGDNFTIEGNKFLGIDTIGVGFNMPTNFAVKNNTFVKDTADGTRLNEAIIVTAVNGGGNRGEISGNRITGTGTIFAGTNMIIADNQISGWKYGAGICGAQDSSNLIIRDNTITAGSGTDVDGTVVNGIENWASQTMISGNNVSLCAGDGIFNGAPRCTIIGNLCQNNNQIGTSMNRSGIACSGDVTHVSADCVVADNICIDTQGTPTQAYGYSDSTAASGITLRGNIFKGNRVTQSLVQSQKVDFAGPQLWASASDGSHNISNGGSATGTLTVTGAVMGNIVAVSHSQDLKGVKFWGYVSAANTVKWRMENGTSSSQSISAGTIRAMVSAYP